MRHHSNKDWSSVFHKFNSLERNGQDRKFICRPHHQPGKTDAVGYHTARLKHRTLILVVLAHMGSSCLFEMVLDGILCETDTEAVERHCIHIPSIIIIPCIQHNQRAGCASGCRSDSNNGHHPRHIAIGGICWGLPADTTYTVCMVAVEDTQTRYWLTLWGLGRWFLYRWRDHKDEDKRQTHILETDSLMSAWIWSALFTFTWSGIQTMLNKKITWAGWWHIASYYYYYYCLCGNADMDSHFC